ncbi:MAG TPA: YncE family protein [Verrucomicrobiae bacterium]|jgi:DNA-binding beta-propeller fold protein YncE
MKKIVVILFSLVVAVICRADGPYHFIQEIPIPGDGGWDYMSIDQAQRLYLSHGTEVAVVNLSSNQICGIITNTPGVHGMAIAFEIGLGVTSNGGENKAGIVDLKTLQTLAKVDTAQGPDGFVYNPTEKEAYLFCGRANAATVVDVRGRKAVATIPLDGRPEFPTVDPMANRVYDNIEDKNEVAVIDAYAHQVITNWPIAPGASASGMAIDTQNHRLFIGCHNQLMLMMDSTDGKILASVPIGKGVDANAFDPGTQLAFASCGDGTTTIAHEVGDTLTVEQTLQTQPGARTMALDPITHNIYVVTAKLAVPAPGERRGRPIPGTFKVLVYGMGK